MGRLKDFREYIRERRNLVTAIEDRLCALQGKYESFFSEVTRVRESELQQLTEHILEDRSKLPGPMNAELDRAKAEAEKEFERELGELRQEHGKLLKEAERKRRLSAEAEKSVRKKNVRLDKKEEDLKARNEDLLARIAEHNGRIRELGRGFGFFRNLFKMREMQRARKVLDAEQADVAARIEALRQMWEREESEHASMESGLQKDWVRLTTEAAAIQAKIEHLESVRPRMIRRSTVEKVLFVRERDLPEPGPDDPQCPRCTTRNPKSGHFCRICARRLHEDRPDLEGSLEEITELNIHFHRFSDGMKACQEIIGLVRGLGSGLEAFEKSVRDMISSENRYPLPKLQIDVPARSIAYGENFETLFEAAKKSASLHPRVFAGQIETLIRRVFTEEQIKGYFERMGEELTRQAKRQWD